MILSQLAHLLKGITMIPKLQPDHLQPLQLDRGNLGAILCAHAFADLAFIVIKASLQLDQTAMKQGGEGPEHFFEVAFQLAVVE
ncbi:MAG: hypothetical protein ABJP79_12165 [Tateyamaria sp.]|uniref:hypothetical protein n=1 Tax=Tateyamaria sp. TaxID=1929288 RepID=UPI00329C0C50